jgi:hypothetical protein
MNTLVKNERQECKICSVKGWIIMRGTVNGKGEGGWICSMYFCTFMKREQ